MIIKGFKLMILGGYYEEDVANCTMMWCDIAPMTSIGTIVLKGVYKTVKTNLKKNEVTFFKYEARLAFLIVRDRAKNDDDNSYPPLDTLGGSQSAFGNTSQAGV
jgi:hypothetical protein